MFAEAIQWAIGQTIVINDKELQIDENTPHLLVDKVREYLNNNDIEYETFSYDDLKPYLPQ